MESVPPPGMASRAFTARLKRTCSICAGSQRTGQSEGASDVSRRMVSPSRRCRSRSLPATIAPRSTAVGEITWRLAKASRWRVRSRARSPASRILLDVLPRHGLPRIERLALGLGAAEDHGEQVVEVVGDAPGQPSDAVQLLRLEEEFLGPDRLGDVPDVHHHRPDVGVVAKVAGHPVDDPVPPVPVAHPGPVRRGGSRPGRHAAPEGRGDAVAVVGMDEREGVRAHHLAFAPAQHLRGGPAPELDVALAVHEQQHVARVLEEGPEPALAALHRLLGSLPFRDVPGDADEADHLAGRVPPRRLGREEDPRTLGRGDGLLDHLLDPALHDSCGRSPGSRRRWPDRRRSRRCASRRPGPRACRWSERSRGWRRGSAIPGSSRTPGPGRSR